MTRLLAVFLVSVFGLKALALTPALPPPIIQTVGLVPGNSDDHPIAVQSVKIQSEVTAGLASTTVRLVLVNPNGRPLEGNVQFPLLDGQKITSFALDIGGEMRPAVPVEKAKGRKVFEEIEQRRVDPALLENSVGNNFRVRVFPVPAGGTRMVEFTYSEGLSRSGKNWLYRLPLIFGEGTVAFDLGLKLSGAEGKPSVKGPLGQVALDKMAGIYTGHVAKTAFRSGGAVDVLLPAAAEPQTIVHEHDGALYFVTQIPLEDQPFLRSRPLAPVIGLLWDSSGSGSNRPHDAELLELDRYFKALGQAEIRLTRLRDRPEPTETYRVTQGEWSALRKALESTVYDGASALADWQPQDDVTEYLLVGDGLLNYGPEKFPVLRNGLKLFALNASLSADTDRLAALAESTGGQLITIDPKQPGAAANALLHERTQVTDMQAEGATELLADNSLGNGVIRIAGKLTNQPALLHLRLKQGPTNRDLTVRIAETEPSHPQASYLWATYKLRSLEAERALHRGEIRRLGDSFGIPTRETSLIVLDTVADYVRYDIAPPAALRAAFDDMKARNGRMAEQDRSKQMDNVVRQFQQKVAWWEGSYDKSDIKTAESTPPQRSMESVQVMTAAPPVPPPPMPAPMPVMPKAASPAMSAPISAPPPAPAPMRAAPLAQASPSAPSPLSAPEIGIALKKWQPNAPYISRMKSASAEEVYAVYLDEKPSYPNSTAFFLDAADILFDKGQKALALRVLSNLMEMDLENRHVLRILGYRLEQAGEPGLAVPIFEKVKAMAEDEPQSFRDLGLAYAATGQSQKAVDQLNEVVTRPWQGRFAEIELIALAELNAVVANAASKVDVSAVDPRLLKTLPLDMRVVMTWDADNSDMDLWVTDPNGEKCYYQHRFTRQGGRLSMDYTNGYGPEEFSLRNAKPGKYKIEANYYGNRQQVVAGATTVQVVLTTNFGKPEATEKMTSLRLKDRGDTVFVGEFEVPGK